MGFPGETESEFAETLSLLEEVQYDSMFSFKYSPRPNTPSLSMSDSISEEEKGRRLAILQDHQREIQAAKHARLVGESFEVLVSGKSRTTKRTFPAYSASTFFKIGWVAEHAGH